MSAKPAAQSAHSAVPASVLEVPTAHSVQLLDSSKSVPEKPAAQRHAEIEVAGSAATFPSAPLATAVPELSGHDVQDADPPVENVSGLHSSHPELSSPSAYCPAAQSVQDADAASAAYVPAEQAVHGVAGAASVSAKPAVHSTHSAVPASVLEVPTAHSVQLLDSSKSVPEKPAAQRHAEIEVDAPTSFVPALSGHDVQLVAPLLENVSTSHSTHGVVGLASVSACPAAH